MKKRRPIFIMLLSLMILATSICAYAAQQGQILASGSVTLSRESEASNRLLIEGDTESHDTVDSLKLIIYLDFKPTESSSFTTLDSWTYTKTSDDLLSKSRYYTGEDGFYRLRGYHSATVSGYGTETMSTETNWLEVN